MMRMQYCIMYFDGIQRRRKANAFKCCLYEEDISYDSDEMATWTTITHS